MRDIIKGIKCDNPTCDFMDESVNGENAKDWINRPCPKCGKILLTQLGYDAAKMMSSLANLLGM